MERRGLGPRFAFDPLELLVRAETSDVPPDGLREDTCDLEPDRRALDLSDPLPEDLPREREDLCDPLPEDRCEADPERDLWDRLPLLRRSRLPFFPFFSFISFFSFLPGLRPRKDGAPAALESPSARLNLDWDNRFLSWRSSSRYSFTMFTRPSYERIPPDNGRSL